MWKHGCPEIDLIGTVHDEALGETDEERGNEVTLAEFNKKPVRHTLGRLGLPC